MTDPNIPIGRTPSERRTGDAAARGRGPAPRTGPKRPSASGVVAASMAVFLTCFSFLAWQLASGHDPALGSPVAAVPRKVIVHRIVRKVVVTDPGGTSGGGGVTSGGGSSSSVQVVPATPAPVQAAPAPTTQAS